MNYLNLNVINMQRFILLHNLFCKFNHTSTIHCNNITGFFQSTHAKFRCNSEHVFIRWETRGNNARNACHERHVILTPISRMKIIIDVYRRNTDANLVNEK